MIYIFKHYIKFHIIFLFILFGYSRTSYSQQDDKQIESNLADIRHSCFDKSKDVLPLNVSHMNSKFYTIDDDICKIKDLDDWRCESSFRYIPLPSKNDVNIILVPMDCGDFPYRFYLLTIKDNQIRSNLYVEGDWWEPSGESENLVEKTRFQIAEDFIISVKTHYDGNLLNNDYILDNNGCIQPANN